MITPAFAFAATDDAIRSSITQQLLTIFVAQVNGLDTVLGLEAQSTNPTQFAAFDSLVRAQLAATTQEIATVLNPANTVVQTSNNNPPPPIAGSSAGNITNTLPVSTMDPLTTTLASVASQILSTSGSQQLALLTIKNTSSAPVTIGSTIQAPQLGESDAAYRARMAASAEAVTQSLLDLGTSLAVSISPSERLEFLTAIQGKTNYDVNSTPYKLAAGASVSIRVLLVNAPASSSYALTVNGTQNTIAVVDPD